MAEDLSPDLQKMMTDGVKQMAEEIGKTIAAHIKAGSPLPFEQLSGDMRAARDLANTAGLDIGKLAPKIKLPAERSGDADKLGKLGIKVTVADSPSKKTRARPSPAKAPWLEPSDLSGLGAIKAQPTPSAFTGSLPSTRAEARRMTFTDLKALHKDLFGTAYKGRRKDRLVEKIASELELNPTLPTPGTRGNAEFFKPNRRPTPLQEKKMAKGALGALNMDQLRAMHVEQFGTKPARNIGRVSLEKKLAAAICNTSNPIAGAVADAGQAIDAMMEDASEAIEEAARMVTGGFSVLPDTPIFSRGFQPDSFDTLNRLNKGELALLIRDLTGRKANKTAKRETLTRRAAKLLNIKIPRGANLGRRNQVTIRPRTRPAADLGPLPLSSVRDFLPNNPTHQDLLALPIDSLRQLHREVIGKPTRATKKASLVPKLHKALTGGKAAPKGRMRATPSGFDSLDPIGARVAQGRALVPTPTSFEQLRGLTVPRLRALHERLKGRKSKHRSKANLVSSLAKTLGLKKSRARKAAHCRFDASVTVGLTQAQKDALIRQAERGRRSKAVRDLLSERYEDMRLPEDC